MFQPNVPGLRERTGVCSGALVPTYPSTVNSRAVSARYAST